MMYNIDPKLWGSSLWKFMHYATFAYPESPTDVDKENMKTFFTTVGKIVPCEKCRLHFSQHIQNRPITDEVLSSRYNLIKWMVDLHNDVNRSEKKPEMSFDEVVNMYLYPKSSIAWKISSELLNIIFLIIVILLIIIYIKRKA